MIVQEIEMLLDKYTSWLKDKTVSRQIQEDWVEITTPYLDRHNDCLQLYARKNGAGYLLTDDGYILNDLLNSGCTMDSPKRQKLLQCTLAGFGVKLEGEELQVKAGLDNFALKKHNLLQAMLAVNDLFYLASPNVASLFLEDVAAWLDLAGVRYTPNVNLTGKSGYTHVFDFVIPKSVTHPERILEAIKPSKSIVERLVFKWTDTRDMRLANSQLFALVDDSESVPMTVLDALRVYDLNPVLWSERDQVKDVLAA